MPAAWALGASLSIACAKAPTRPTEVPLVATDGAQRPFGEELARSPWTVVVFVSAECSCLTAHEARLAELVARYGTRGVRFVGIDSESGSTVESVRREAHEHHLAFPVYLDRGAQLAVALGAEYATYTVVLDGQGRVRYRGGIDSDKNTVHPDATPYLAEALEDLLAGREPRRPVTKSLGCVLRKW